MVSRPTHRTAVDIRRRSYELDDFARQIPAAGQVPVWDATRGLYVPSSAVTPVTITAPAAGDALVWDGAAWVNGPAFGTWTPAIVQGVSLTTTVNEARYVRLGKFYTCWFDLAVSAGTGTLNGVVTITKPVTSRTQTGGNIKEIGGAYANTSAGQLMVSVVTVSGSETSVSFIRRDVAAANYFGPDPSISLVSPNRLSGWFSFEAA